MSIKLNLSKLNTYIVAVSGGIDSMVLLNFLISHGYKIIVVHFNHQKREDSYKDHDLIKNVTDAFMIPYHMIKLNIKSGNFQEKAREERYYHLEQIADQYHTKHIVTAHHSDDLIETVLMKLVRGSNLLGYSGIQEISNINGYIYHRPLLKYSKDDLKNYAKSLDLQYNEDSSNDEDDYLRNRIRHHVVPRLKEENDLNEHILNFSSQVYLASDFIRSQSKTFLNSKLEFNLKEFNLLHEAIKWDVISYLLEQINVSKSYEKLSMILKQLVTIKPNVEIKLSSNFMMIKSYDLVKIKALSKDENKNTLPTLTISHKKTDVSYNSIELCYNELDFPITLRHRKNGDILKFDFGRKKLKDFLIDKKIPKEIRDSLLLAVDKNDQILWIPNLYINHTLGQTNKIYLEIKENPNA